ncbi:uncharacterized protein LOC144116424 [Amblyomma americanum]
MAAVALNWEGVEFASAPIKNGTVDEGEELAAALAIAEGKRIGKSLTILTDLKEACRNWPPEIKAVVPPRQKLLPESCVDAMELLSYLDPPDLGGGTGSTGSSSSELSDTVAINIRLATVGTTWHPGTVRVRVLVPVCLDTLLCACASLSVMLG